MDDNKTIKTGSEGQSRDEEPTVLAGGSPPAGRPAPFQRTTLPSGDAPTPWPGQPRPGQPSQPQPWGGQAEGATVMISQRAAPVFAWLVVIDGPERGRVHTLKPETTVGRLPGNDVVLPDDACSGQHLKIRLESQEGEPDRFVLTDLASRNGTYVGSKETYRDAASRVYRHVLQDGDYLLLGETTLVFKRV